MTNGTDAGSAGEGAVDDTKATVGAFRVDASDEDGCYVVITSAQSDFEQKAQELAEAAVLDDLGTEENPAQIETTTYLGRCEDDIWEKIGPV